jgi:hypothetical protein
MKKIYKYFIPEDGKVTMPVGAKVLSVGFQNGIDEVLWASVDTEEKESESRFFKVIPTGDEFDDEGLTYIGSANNDEYGYVFHLYESDTYIEDKPEDDTKDKISML